MFLKVTRHGKPMFVNVTHVESVSIGEKKGTIDIVTVGGQVITCDLTLEGFKNAIS